MKKLVVLKFDGNFESGFQVNLEIANEGQRAYRTTTAKLPENIKIPQLLNNWHEIYCSRYSQFRIKSGGSRRVNLESLNQECTRESINLLASFHEWLNASSFTSIVNSFQELNPKDEIRIIITTYCHELRQLPWHLWDVLIKFPLLEVALSSPNAERGERALRDKIRILIILGDSSNIDIEADKKLLHNFCGDDAEIILLKQPSREELNRYLQDDLGWDILFFSGHSRTQNPTPNPLPASEEGAKNKMHGNLPNGEEGAKNKMEGRIYLNNHDSLTIAELRDALQVAIKRRLQIAFFNSCDGLGIAYELEQLHIPQVIVMREPVPDKVAQEFLKYFLQEFTGGKSLYISVKNARLELQQLESEFPCASWLPIIIQNQTETPPTWQSLGIISFCPYQGLSAFKEENAEYFFGRDKATTSLVTAVNSRPLVAVVGASGSGKSSLVFAGLIPQLRGDTINNWLILSFRPGKNPFAALAVALVSALNLPENERRLAELELDVNLKSDSVALQNFIKDLTPLPPFPTRGKMLHSHPREGEGKRILLIADQFEEIYTLCTDAEERKVFLDGLLQAVNNAPFFTLLLTLRADFLSRALDDYEPFGRSLQQYQLEPVVRMNREELEAAIALPAKQLGFEFEEGLCNTIIDDIQDGDGRLPLLEFTLTQLWKQQYAGILTHQAYDKIGGVEQALANYAETIYKDLSEGERETAQRVFIQLVQPGEGTEDTRKLATSEEVGGENWDLVTRLADKRLVVTNWDELRNEETVEVVHEALIRHWGRLRGWMQENRKFRIWQQGLMVALQQWVDSSKDEGALLRGATLAVAEDWLQQRGEEVSKPQRWFIEKSVELRERERKQKQRLRRNVIAGLVCGLVMISGFAGVSEIRRTDAEIGRLSGNAEKYFEVYDHEAALAEAIKGGKILRGSIWKPWIGGETQMQAVSTLREVVDEFKVRTLKGHTSGVTSVSFRPDGKTLASASNDGTVKLWDVNSGKEINTLKGHTSNVIGVSFSPDGKTLASTSEDHTVKLWDVNSGREIKTLKGHTDNVIGVNFSPDGKTLASASEDYTVKLWDVNSGKEIKTLTGHTDYVWSVSFSPDGKTLASASNDKTVKLWDRDSGREINTLKGHTHYVSSVSFSPDGKTLASASWDKTMKLWDVNSGSEIKTLKGHTDLFTSVSFSPDGKTLASAHFGTTVELWDVNSGMQIKTFKGHTDWGNSVSFSPDGKTLASASKDKTVKLWDINAGQKIKTLKGHTDFVTNISFSPDGKTLASASKDKTVKLWDINTGREIKTFKVHTDNVSSISFSPDGKTLASASKDKTVKLWDINTGREIKTFKVHTDNVSSISFSPDGKTLASTSEDKTVKLWDINTGREIKTFKGHTNMVNTVSFNPDGKILASASGDNTSNPFRISLGGDYTVRLWDINTGREMKILKGHTNKVNSVSFSPDGKTLASASDDTTIILWNLDLDDLLVKGCKLIRGYLENNPDVSEEDRHLCDNIKNNS
ncbi:CHAT domain-containing protein [Scytonema hofmannii FACHB-248]|uniref:CHAT domain-containing protein n=1 Tax=Scytonema hofmannii FACHB-248 TaxID=1842502 RepID=A0ABR8GST3_9CYAN|nr:CHAT domain-containing protein [Scytonema hofmannii]MBD2606491.1 CHAT domain-containing protein [Scytonema hofmannii FACHB-248]